MANEPVPRTGPATLPPARQAGVAIAFGSILSVAFMAFHPTIEARGTAGFLEEVIQKAPLTGLVHGSLIAIMGVLVYGFSCLAARLGMSSFLVRAGLIAYLLGAIAGIAAALVSGFIIPEFVSRYPALASDQLEAIRHELALCRAANQVCSRLWVMAVSIAMILWSLALLRSPRPARTVGTLGSVAGAIIVVALLSGHLPMSVHGAGAFVLVHAIWSLAVASLLIRERL